MLLMVYIDPVEVDRSELGEPRLGDARTSSIIPRVSRHSTRIPNRYDGALDEQARRVSLFVNGVTGLVLSAVRQEPPSAQPTLTPKGTPAAQPLPKPITLTRVLVTVTPPEYGIASFDRLLEGTSELG